MRKIFLFLSFVFNAFFLFAQQAVITGKITRPEADSILVAISPNPLSAQEAQSTSVVSTQGFFSITVPVSQPTVGDFVYEEEVLTVFLQPGDQLEARFNADNFLKSIKFKGQGANENNFLAAFTLKFFENEEYQVLPDNIRLNEKSFTDFLDYRKADQLKFFNNYTSKSTVSEAFKTYMLAQIEYSWALDRLMFVDLRKRIMGGPLLQVSSDYYKFLDEIELNNPNAVRSYAYVEFLKNYMHHLAAATNHRKGDMDYYQVVYNLAKEKLKGEPRNLILASTLHESIRKGFFQYTNAMFQDFESLNTNKDLNDFLAVTYNVNKSFAMGSLAPDFKLKSLEGKQVSLSDFRGKIVYLNFWSTKCGLCQMDLPYAQELEKELVGKNVVFVNIGVDGDEALWRSSVARRKLTGVQLYGANKEEILKKYKVIEVPAYYLIDTDGTFISTKARRPGSATSDILQALKQ